MNLSNLLAENSGGWGIYIIFGVIIVLFVVMSIFNNKQRKKQAEEDKKRKDSLCAGTSVITIGGIVGTVVSVDHENSTFVLETEGSKIKFDKRAIYQMTLPEGAEVKEAKEEVKTQPEEKAE